MFVHLRERLSSGGFLSNVLVLVGGTFAAQLISIASSPFITRLYLPSNFGLYAIYASVISILLVVVSLRYEMAIPLPGELSVAMNLLRASGMIAFIMSAITAILIGSNATAIAAWLNAPKLSTYLWILPIALFGGGLNQALSYWVTRQQKFMVLSQTRLYQAVGQFGVQFAVGLGRFGTIGLLLGDLAGRILGTTTLLRSAKVPFRDLKLKQIYQHALIYKDFPLYSMWAGLINILGLQLPPVLLSAFFTTDQIGFYALAMRILGVPVSLVGQAVSQVFYPLAASRKRDASFPDFVARLTVILLVGAIVAFGVLIVQGPFLFSVIFGTRWIEAGVYTQILSLWFIASFVASPISTIALVANKQRLAMLITVYETALRIVGLYIGGVMHSIVLSLALYSLAGFVISMIYTLWVLRLAGCKLTNLLNRTLYPTAIGAFCIVLLLMVDKIAVKPLSLLVTLMILVLASLWLWRFVRRTLL